MLFTKPQEKRRGFLPNVQRASGKPTTYLEGYPTEDGRLMGPTNFHVHQIGMLSELLLSHFTDDTLAYVGTASIVYYYEGDPTKFITPDNYVAVGVPASPIRASFYTWAEGTVPTIVFDFIDVENPENRDDKLKLYFEEVGVHEYFINQPEGTAPPEFRGWRQTAFGYEELLPHERGALYSESVNLWFLPHDQSNKVRLMRPYLPDGTAIPTLSESNAELRAAKEETRIYTELAEAYDRIAELKTELARLRGS